MTKSVLERLAPDLSGRVGKDTNSRSQVNFELGVGSEEISSNCGARSAEAVASDRNMIIASTGELTSDSFDPITDIM